MDTDPNLKNAITEYSALDIHHQILFLTEFGWQLTIAARDTYDAGTERVLDPERLRRINEIQHRLYGHLRKLQANDTARAADDRVVVTLLEHVDLILRAQAEYGFWQAMERVRILRQSVKSAPQST